MTRAEQRRLAALQAAQASGSGPGGSAMPPSLVLELYSEPVAFHRPFVELTGSVTAALFLSCACDEAGKLPGDSDGWIHLSTEQWRHLSCLSRTEQGSARKALRERGLLEERRVGMPARLAVRVNIARIMEQLQVQAKRNFSAFDEIDYSRIG